MINCWVCFGPGAGRNKKQTFILSGMPALLNIHCSLLPGQPPELDDPVPHDNQPAHADPIYLHHRGKPSETDKPLPNHQPAQTNPNSPTTLANLSNLMTCPYIICSHMQVLTTPTTLPEPGNPIPHNHQLALQIMTVPTTLASFMNLVPIIKYILMVLKLPEI